MRVACPKSEEVFWPPWLKSGCVCPPIVEKGLIGTGAESVFVSKGDWAVWKGFAFADPNKLSGVLAEE